MNIGLHEMIETIRMVQVENLDIRTVTMGINLLDCADSDFEKMNLRVYEKITTYAKDLKEVAEKAEKEFGIPIINKRISITPIAEILGNATKDQAVELAKTLDRAAISLESILSVASQHLYIRVFQKGIKYCLMHYQRH